MYLADKLGDYIVLGLIIPWVVGKLQRTIFNQFDGGGGRHPSTARAGEGKLTLLHQLIQGVVKRLVHQFRPVLTFEVGYIQLIDSASF